MENRLISGMGLVRVLSAGIELLGAYFIFRSIRVEEAFRVNALLGLAGPLIFLTVTALGLAGMAGRLDLGKTLMILGGVALILSATR
ncbi:MAG: YqhV family protein [Firmicutes bacterium]|nr:YqhV family protein [Bacillota bacterium]